MLSGLVPQLKLSSLSSRPELTSVSAVERPRISVAAAKIMIGPMLHIRPAVPADVPTILRFIRELAEYERALDNVIATEADLLRDGWGLGPNGQTPLHPSPPSRFRALIAEWHTEPAGFALYFQSYSTWIGRHGIRLEDLYVTPTLRGHGIGKALLAELARIALSEGCQRLEWDVLTWNEPAIAASAQ